MTSTWRQSDMFKNNYAFWKVFGIWSGRKPNKNYKYYSFVYLVIFSLFYNIILTLNLAYTPANIETLIREVIFYFTEVAVTSKLFMVVIMRDKILEALNLLDGKDLEGDDEISMDIIKKHSVLFMTVWKYWAWSCHFAFSLQNITPVIAHFIFNTDIMLPVSQYYFLTDEVRGTYFNYLFIYQSFGIYGHMVYNVTVDSFVAGLLLMAITQFKVLNAKLINLKLSDEENQLSFDVQEKIQMMRLRNFLSRYDVVLKYCDVVQEILNVSMFFVFGISSIIICVVMCALLLPSTTESFVFLVMFLAAMTLQIFIPGYLGTHLSYESKELVFAAYCSEWIPRSESFKRSIRVFVGRANKPIEITGLKMLPLSLSTFTSFTNDEEIRQTAEMDFSFLKLKNNLKIIKTAYSFFALIRNFQE